MEFTYIGNQGKKDVRLASSFANGAFVTANSAASFANAAFDRANAAFAQANTGGGGGAGTPITIYSDVFVANGATSTFNLNTIPTDENHVIAVVDGITQLRSTYTVSGNTIFFDTTFENGANVEITTISGGGSIDPYAANTANLAYAQANAAFAAANSSTDIWVRTQANNAYDKANSAAIFANAAFTAANNATDTWVRNQANTAYDTANSSGSFANGAFVTANASYLSQNTTASFANGAFVTANSAASFANGAFLVANSAAIFANAAFTAANNATDTWVRNQANNAYDKANSGAIFANASFATANASYVAQNTTASFANGAFDRANAAYAAANNATDTWVRNQANTAYDTANSSGVFANGAFVTANSAASFANGAFLRANSAYGVSNSAASFANGAFLTANSAASFANGAFTVANTGSSLASLAFSHANAAFNVANSSGGSSSGLAITTDNFTANGNTTTFTLSVVPSSEDFITAVVDGTVQYRNSYTVSNGVVTFDSTLENGALIEITSILQGANVTVAAAKKYFTFVQTGTITTPVSGTARSYPTANCTITNVYASLGTAASDTFTFVLKKNGSTVGTYNMSAGTYRMGATAASVSLTTSDYLTINITAGTGATDLKVDLEYS